MLNKRDVIIFLAGASAFHGFSHLVLYFILPMPYDFKIMVLTSSMNTMAIIGSVLLAVFLLVWAARMDKN